MKRDILENQSKQNHGCHEIIEAESLIPLGELTVVHRDIAGGIGDEYLDAK